MAESSGGIQLSPLTAESLVVLVHGLDGCPGELGALASFLREAAPDAGILSADCNINKTHDGVLAGGKRLAAAIQLHIQEHAGRFRDITFVGMSLGGIYCRVAAGLLFDPLSRTVAGLRPRLFLSIATPHIGVGPFGALGAVPHAAVRAYARLFLDETERELLLLDGDSSAEGVVVGEGEAALARPVMRSLAAPSSCYIAALGAFASRVCFANACNDLLVPFETAAILPDSRPPAAPPFGAPRVLHDTRHDSRHVQDVPVTSFTAESVPAPIPPASAPAADAERRHGDGATGSTPPTRARPEHPSLALMREMAATLDVLGWRRVAVAFPGLLPIAHCAITAHRGSALSTLMYRHGEPLVRHQMEAILGNGVASSSSSEAAPRRAVLEVATTIAASGKDSSCYTRP